MKGKRKRKDVELFSLRLTNNILALHDDLVNTTYQHGNYHAFKISDPKPRDIHKASVRDRLLHHAVYRILYPYFDTKFIFDSYSCRKEKGTHKALERFTVFGRKISRNHTQTVWVLKCDIRKFFANIDHEVLYGILDKHNLDESTSWLLRQIISSFYSQSSVAKGLPLGNLTSQLLVNVYMNEFDHYVKRALNVKHYIRYADDFVVLHEDRNYLEGLLPQFDHFLTTKLKLQLHPNKVYIKTVASGVDFLGWIHFPRHRVLRTATKRRMIRNLQQSVSKETRASYTGLLSHGNTFKLKNDLGLTQEPEYGS